MSEINHEIEIKIAADSIEQLREVKVARSFAPPPSNEVKGLE